jgi:hypothetical protein
MLVTPRTPTLTPASYAVHATPGPAVVDDDSWPFAFNETCDEPRLCRDGTNASDWGTKGDFVVDRWGLVRLDGLAGGPCRFRVDWPDAAVDAAASLEVTLDVVR